MVTDKEKLDKTKDYVLESIRGLKCQIKELKEKDTLGVAEAELLIEDRIRLEAFEEVEKEWL